MVYEYTTTVDFPLVKNKNGWYVTEEAVKKMVRYYNTHYGCKAPVILEKEADENNIENYFKESPIVPISKIRDFMKEYKEAKITEDTLYFERRTEEEIKEIKELLNGLYD